MITKTTRSPGVIFLILFLTLLFLAACDSVRSLSPEAVVLNRVAKFKGMEPGTARILFKQTLEDKKTRKDHVFLFVFFFGKDEAGTRHQCMRLFDTVQDENNQWQAFGKSGQCAKIDSFGFTERWGGMSCTDLLSGREDADALYTYISGQELFNRAEAVKIIWEDSQVQTVRLKENVFFAMREGKIRHLRLDWLDKDGNVVRSDENTQDPCGVIILP